MRAFAILTLLTGSVLPISATTLQQLPLDDMARQSTAILRARVLSAHAIIRDGDVFTIYQLETLENLKAAGSQSTTRELAVPGGVADGIRQAVAGAPVLRKGAEYVLFLWTGRSGLTQLMGLSQGLFSVEPKGSSGDALVKREAASDRMLDAAGRPVQDRALVMPWSQLRAQVHQVLSSRPMAAAETGRK